MADLNQDQIRSLKLGKSLKTKFEAMHTVNMKREHIGQILNESEKTGLADLALTSKAILLRSDKGDYEEARELTNWSIQKGSDIRKVVVKSFIRNKQSTLLVHQVARLKRDEAAILMQDYFQEGGQLKDVAEWLAAAGSILKTGNLPDETDGLWDWIKEGAEKAVDAVVGAINTVADAIAAAGKNLADAVAHVANWTQSKINDFVEAILSAGKSVGQILTEALKKGTATLNKFIQAVIEAGRRGADVLNWAVNQSLNVLKSTLQKLEQIYGSFTTLLQEIARIAASGLGTVVRALINIGKTVKDIIIRIDRIAYATAKKIITELRNIGKSVREIMLALVDASRYIARIVMDALLSIGTQLSQMFREVIQWSASLISKLIGALKDMGKSLGMVLDAFVSFTSQQLVKLMQALRIIWVHVKDILHFIAQKAESTIKTLLVALLGTGLLLKDLLSSILTELRAAFREGLIKGLMQIGHTALKLMKTAVLISASVAALLFSIIMDILGNHRQLTAEERAEAEKIFGSSINLDMVRLTDASFAADFIMWLNKNRPFTTMYVINYKSGDTLSMSVLIHELAHIWQAVTSGGVYMLEALHSQFFGKGYNLTENDVKNANGDIKNLEREQQAVLVQDYYRATYLGQTIPLPVSLIKPLARQVYTPVYTPGVYPVLDLNINNRIVRPVVSVIR